MDGQGHPQPNGLSKIRGEWARTGRRLALHDESGLRGERIPTSAALKWIAVGSGARPPNSRSLPAGVGGLGGVCDARAKVVDFRVPSCHHFLLTRILLVGKGSEINAFRSLA